MLFSSLTYFSEFSFYQTLIFLELKTTTKKPKPCYNVSKRTCHQVLIAGKCGMEKWKRDCCKTCGGGCVNLWKNKKCQGLKFLCKRNRTVRRKCKKTCNVCEGRALFPPLAKDAKHSYGTENLPKNQTQAKIFISDAGI